MPTDSPITVSRTIANGGTQPDGSQRVFGRWTFEYLPARKFVEKHIHGRVLNACAGQCELHHPSGKIVRNDLSPDRDADTHHDVAEIGQHFEPESFDCVVFDPPFDDLQAADKYDSLRADSVLKAFEQFDELVAVGGTVVTFGWNSWGMSSLDGWDRQETVLFQRGPVKRDVIATVDKKRQNTLTGYSTAPEGSADE